MESNKVDDILPEGNSLLLEDKLNVLQPARLITIKDTAKIFLSMAMAAIGLSTNLKDLKSMGFKPFIVGFVAMVTVGLISILVMQLFNNYFL